MKKQSLLLIAGGILALASCNTETAGNAEADQAKVDSIVNARVEEIKMELQMKNDSIINAMAVWRADSIIAAMSGKKVDAASKPKPVAKKPVVTTEPNSTEPPKKTNPKAGRFGEEVDNSNKKKARFEEQAAEEEKQKSADKKKERFNK